MKLCFKVQEQSITFNWTLAVLLALPMSSAKAPLVSACWHVSAPCQLARKMFMSGSASAQAMRGVAGDLLLLVYIMHGQPDPQGCLAGRVWYGPSRVINARMALLP